MMIRIILHRGHWRWFFEWRRASWHRNMDDETGMLYMGCACFGYITVDFWHDYWRS